jgi:phosphoesterase RecJ-like protein
VGIKLGADIDRHAAEAMFLGIVYDTGSFAYPKTTAVTFQTAFDLVKRGVRPYDIHTRLYENKTVSFLVLQAKVLATLEFRFDQRVAIQRMTRETILQSGSAYEEGQPLINLPMSAEVVKVSIFFKENMEGLMRCSLRSKGNIDVAEIARRYSGGGHRTAAGFKLSSPLELVLEEVLQHLRHYFED